MDTMAPSLQLAPRQRAMLQEMGVRLWLPGDGASGNAPSAQPAVRPKTAPQSPAAQAQDLGRFATKALVIGRAPGDDGWPIDDAELSRAHLALEVSGTTLTARDLGSRNGSWVSGQRLAPQMSHVLALGEG